MDISKIIQVSNEMADEQEDASVVIEFINDAISKINIECDSNFPTYNLNQSSEVPPFPEKWIRSMIVPFVVGRIKQRDSSQFEYSDAYAEFFANLNEFKTKFQVPDEFKDESSNKSYGSDLYTNPPYIDWGRW